MIKNKKEVTKREIKKRLITLEVKEPDELLKFLIANLPGKSRNSIKSFLAHKQVTIGDKRISQFDHPLKAGDLVIINPDKVLDSEKNEGVSILFEDSHLIVVEKPAGLLSVATENNKANEKTVYSVLNEHVKRRGNKNKVYVVHRLDRETSGVMMFAKDEEVQKILRNNWQDIVIERSYTVIVEGVVKKDEDTLTSWLQENKALVVYSTGREGDGQKAITQYKVLKRGKKNTLLRVNLETGRKNQIRVQMQDMGHPIIGDVKYGATENPANRLGLHAHVIKFKHPVTGEVKRYESKIPEELMKVFEEK